jgi:Amt family ammonium transporter
MFRSRQCACPNVAVTPEENQAMNRSYLRRGVLVGTLLSLLPAVAWAQDAAATAATAATSVNPEPWAPNMGDTAWMLVSCALVLLMTPGLALFYGGMVRRKNVLSMYMQSFIAMGIISLIWAVAGYSLAFGKGIPGLPWFVGGTEFLFLNDVGSNLPAPLASTIPHQLFMVFQMMFAIITPALISGAFAERMKFKAYLVFISLWSLLVYSPIAHWVWHPEGWLFKMGALDFAGGTVVHISSGVTALVAAIMMGKRRGYPNEEMRPHNLTTTLLGTGLLWFGWFGFNGGSAVASNGVAVAAFVNTHLGAAAAMMTWVMVEWAHRGKPTALGAASGAVAGLVAITPGAGFVTPMGAIAIGALVTVVCYYAVVVLKAKLGYDDSLDTFGVHGVGGTVGAILTGVFCTTSVNSAGKDGLLYGHGGQVVTQLIGVAATWAFAALVGGLLLFIVDKTIGLRPKSSDEEVGLDLADHGEEGYVM